MPLGSLHDISGWLDRDQNGFLLRPDAGGEWRLDMGMFVAWKARTLAGRRVRVHGTRDAFNILAVASIEPAA